MTEYTRRALRETTRYALEQLVLHHRTGPQVDKARAALAQLDSQAKPDLREPDIFREYIQPGLWAVLDASHCIVMEVRTADGAVLLARVALSDCDQVTEAIGNARMARAFAEEQAGAERRAALAEAMRPGPRLVVSGHEMLGENAASRNAAAVVLFEAGLTETGIEYVLKRAYGHTGATFNVKGTEQLGTVSYDRDAGTYAVRVPERGCCGMPGTDCTGPCARSQDETGPVDADGLTALVQHLAGGPVDSTDDYPPNCYEVHAGIRPPRKGGKVRAIVFEKGAGRRDRHLHLRA